MKIFCECLFKEAIYIKKDDFYEEQINSIMFKAQPIS